MTFSVDKSGCIGCGLCEGTCPEVFRISSDGTAEAYAQPCESAVEAKAKEAESGCPTSVIKSEA